MYNTTGWYVNNYLMCTCEIEYDLLICTCERSSCSAVNVSKAILNVTRCCFGSKDSWHRMAVTHPLRVCQVTVNNNPMLRRCSTCTFILGCLSNWTTTFLICAAELFHLSQRAYGVHSRNKR